MCTNENTSLGTRKEGSCTYLSLEMLQLTTVFRSVLIMINGSWIAEFGLGGPYMSSLWRFLSTKFFTAMCCKIIRWSCWVFALIRSIFFFLSFSRALHSWSELVGKPSHLISFFSFEMIFIAISTFSASYTLLRIFFWSYCYTRSRINNSIDLKYKTSRFKFSYNSFVQIIYLISQWVCMRWVCEFPHQLVRHFIVRRGSLLLHFFTDFHRKVSETFADFVCFPAFAEWVAVQIHQLISKGWQNTYFMETEILKQEKSSLLSDKIVPIGIPPFAISCVIQDWTDESFARGVFEQLVIGTLLLLMLLLQWNNKNIVKAQRCSFSIASIVLQIHLN